MAVRAEAPVVRAQPLSVLTLHEEQVANLRLGWHAKLQPEEIRRLLVSHPGRSVWAPPTLEYAIVSPWRHRPEIGQLVDFSAVRHPESIIEEVVARCQAAGDAMVVSVELDEVRRPAFYQRIGFDMLEEIVTYEWSGRSAPFVNPAIVQFARADPTEERDRAMLLAIDHGAFPWLWWNSDLEFQSYGVTPGVDVFVAQRHGRPIGYVGLTCFPGWGHLDRIAVLPHYQGEGVGQAVLGFAMQQMLRRGVRRIGLSTQLNNVRSRRLYEHFGFRRAPTNDYRLYGRKIERRGRHDDEG